MPVRRTKVIIAGLPMLLSRIVLLVGCMIKKFLEDSRNDLTCCCICTKGCNETEHCCPTVKLFCFRSHGENKIWSKYKELKGVLWVFARGFWLLELMFPIRQSYLTIEMIRAECNLFFLFFFLAKWLFKLEELVLHLEARFK